MYGAVTKSTVIVLTAWIREQVLMATNSVFPSMHVASLVPTQFSTWGGGSRNTLH